MGRRTAGRNQAPPKEEEFDLGTMQMGCVGIQPQQLGKPPSIAPADQPRFGPAPIGRHAHYS
jgi:hypothetical protein